MIYIYLVSNIHFQIDSFMQNSSKLDALCDFKFFLFHQSIFKILCLAIVYCLSFDIKSFMPSFENLYLISLRTPCPIDIPLNSTNLHALLFS
jgi:hypothetical protein